MEQPFHVIVEEGPDRDKKIGVLPAGIRLGRSSKNDVKLNDMTMSRFHCRLFWKAGDGLWAADLGSANQTLLNRQPLQESRVRVGDRLTLGQTILKVVLDQPAAAGRPGAGDKTREAPPPPPAPGKKADAALRSDPAAAGLRSPSRSPLFQKALFAALAVMAAIALAALLFRTPSFTRLTGPANASSPGETPVKLGLLYEKIQATPRNIFRYELALRDDRLSIQVDDLLNNRHIPNNQRKAVEPDAVRELAAALESGGVFALKESYQGLASNTWDRHELTVTLGARTHRSMVLNTVEPDEFKKIRETLEAFGQNELNLSALALPPDKLIAMARETAQRGRSLYDERNVKPDNLALAIRALKETEWYLESIEPKPDFYKEAVALRADAERQLQEVYETHRFLADRALKLKDWPEAARELKTIRELIPDRADDRHKQAAKKLLEIERRLKK